MNNQVAVVTGGSRGIGRAVCIKLANDGINIVLNYVSNGKAADETAEECRKYGVTAISVQADVKKTEDCERLFQEALKINGRIDILVNNAGITRDNLIMRMSDNDFNDVIETNLKGTFVCMKLASKIMMKQRYGRIINMSSVVGVRGNAGQVNYSASKAGIIGMTKSLAKELASRNITVNAVAPGMIETDMTNLLSDKVKKTVISEIPAKRMGMPKDIACAVAFFAKEESQYITGQVLCVDGGMAV